MAAADDLWTAVVAAYDSDGLVTLTNIRDRSATTIDTAAGTAAAQAVIDLWPAYAQVVYDEFDALHVEAGILGVIAMLWRRGGTASRIEQVKWEEVFGDDGVLSKIKRTGARGRQGPASDSQFQPSVYTRAQRPWSDRGSLPPGLLPNPTSASGD